VPTVVGRLWAHAWYKNENTKIAKFSMPLNFVTLRHAVSALHELCLTTRLHVLLYNHGGKYKDFGQLKDYCSDESKHCYVDQSLVVYGLSIPSKYDQSFY